MGKKITDLCLSKPVLFPLKPEDLIAVLTFYPTCADPGIFVRGGGGGGPGQSDKKSSGNVFFF